MDETIKQEEVKEQVNEEVKPEVKQEPQLDYEKELKKKDDIAKEAIEKRDSLKGELKKKEELLESIKAEQERLKAEHDKLMKALEEKDSLITQTIEERRNELLEQLPEGELREFAKESFTDNKKLQEFIKLQAKKVTVDTGTNIGKPKTKPAANSFDQWSKNYLGN